MLFPPPPAHITPPAKMSLLSLPNELLLLIAKRLRPKPLSALLRTTRALANLLAPLLLDGGASETYAVRFRERAERAPPRWRVRVLAYRAVLGCAARRGRVGLVAALLVRGGCRGAGPLDRAALGCARRV